MSIVEFHYHELDSAIDERIEASNDIRNEYGKDILDSEGKLKNSGDFPLEPHTLLGIIQKQQEQITDLLERVRGYRIYDLLERVERLEKEVEKL